MSGVSTWSYDPDQPELPYLPVETLPGKVTWRCCITSNQLYQPHTHWIPPRTLPCVGEDCGGCGSGLAKREEGFVSVIRSRDRAHIIMRLTKHACEVILRGTIPGCSLRGVVFEAKRRGPKPNGFVQIALDPVEKETARLPVAPDLEVHLFRVWRLDGWHPSAELGEYAKQLKLYLGRNRDPLADAG